MRHILIVLYTLLLTSCATYVPSNPWLMVDDFEHTDLQGWYLKDPQNNTQPFIPSPQVTQLVYQDENQSLLKKPAKDGVVGNRKALTFKALPQPIAVGEIATLYTRINVQSFPNNHAFGVSNLMPKEIVDQGYDAFEATLRVTDKHESDGYKNDGTLMVKVDSDHTYRQYANIHNPNTKVDGKPLLPGIWYEIWYVVNNKTQGQGGQVYDVYVKGGEFEQQTRVYQHADFRMKRALPLIYFLANCNTGPLKQPYGNGGLYYDDIFMSKGLNLTTP
ncbi:hypothetical protein [Alteromonas sp. C1M14]|uniref:hypothetical protein n=1 Tax=Alteromonas sp. C1M14 TaxID=2841567 RepID=UPI001C0A2FD4|nr:hypothetical protein [Alteromonas sp. C1M14]MBU2978951.1 hypothetical protein [Alteromonas sp. C1M14]